MLTIKGFIHINEDEAFYGEVDIVNDVRFWAGTYVGYMALTNGEYVTVKQHPCGNYNGSIITEEQLFTR